MYGYLARVKTDQFDYDMLTKIQRDFQRSFQKSAAQNFMRVVKREGLGSAVKKGASMVFRRSIKSVSSLAVLKVELWKISCFSICMPMRGL